MLLIVKIIGEVRIFFYNGGKGDEKAYILIGRQYPYLVVFITVKLN